MPAQRSVSSELTHFVGRGRPAEEQYALLVQLLTTGRLRRPSDWQHGLTSLNISEGKRFSGNAMFNPAMVCFCDIPPGEFRIHMQKYSRFGLAFAKNFLIACGANPVFYIAKHAGVHDLRAAGRPGIAREDLTYSGLVDDGSHMVERQLHDTAWVREFHRFMNGADRELEEVLVTVADAHRAADLGNQLTRVRLVRRWLELYFFSFAKAFDDTLPDDHPDNYYLEREWRTLHRVRFRLSDVHTVILPRVFLARFRQDVPDYVGSVVAAEQLS